MPVPSLSWSLQEAVPVAEPVLVHRAFSAGAVSLCTCLPGILKDLRLFCLMCKPIYLAYRILS